MNIKVPKPKVYIVEFNLTVLNKIGKPIIKEGIMEFMTEILDTNKVKNDAELINAIITDFQPMIKQKILSVEITSIERKTQARNSYSII